MQRVNRLQRDNSITITGYIPLNRVTYRLANRNGLPRTAASQFLHMSFHVEPSGHHRIYCAINHGRQEGDGLIGRHASDRRFYVLIQKVESKKKILFVKQWPFNTISRYNKSIAAQQISVKAFGRPFTFWNKWRSEILFRSNRPRQWENDNIGRMYGSGTRWYYYFWLLTYGAVIDIVK